MLWPWLQLSCLLKEPSATKQCGRVSNNLTSLLPNVLLGHSIMHSVQLVLHLKHKTIEQFANHDCVKDWCIVASQVCLLLWMLGLNEPVSGYMIKKRSSGDTKLLYDGNHSTSFLPFAVTASSFGLSTSSLACNCFGRRVLGRHSMPPSPATNFSSLQLQIAAYIALWFFS